MINHIVGASLVLAPFIFRMSNGVSNIRLSKSIFLYACIMAIVFFYEKTKEINLIDKSIMLILIILAFLNTNSFMSSRFFLQFQMLSSFMCLAYFLMTSDLDKPLLKGYLITLCLIETAWVIASTQGISYYDMIANTMDAKLMEESQIYSNYAIGSLNNSNLSGALISVISPLFLSKKYILLLPFPILALYLGNSALPIICLFGAICYFAWYSILKEKYLPYTLLGISSFIYFFLGSSIEGFFSGGTRLGAWLRALEFSDLPLLGNGLAWTGDFFAKVKLDHTPEIFAQLHNEYLQTFLEMGFVGLGLLLILWFRGIERSKDTHLLACLFAIAINSYGNFYFHVSLLSFVGVVIYSMTYNTRAIK